MNQIVLKKITRVYRFGTQESSWERSAAAEDHFIAYNLHGFFLHERNGTPLPFGRDMVMVANSEDLYRVTHHDLETEKKRGSCIAVHFTTQGPFDLHFSILDCKHSPQIKSDFFKIMDAWNQYQADSKPSSEYACIACFYSILSKLLMLMEPAAAEQTDPLVLAKDYIDRNFADSTLAIADAAASAGVGQRRFGDLFLQKYHQTPGRYLTACRMAEAVRLLQQSQLSIAEIAALCGYSNASYFIRVFRQEMGLSPNGYRMRWIGKQ